MYGRRLSENRISKGVSPIARNNSMGDRFTQSAVCTSSSLRSLRPCLGQGASRRARVGRVRNLAFLSSLLDRFSFHLLGSLAMPNRQLLGCIIVPGCHVCLLHSRLDRVFPQYLPIPIIHHSDAKLNLLS